MCGGDGGLRERSLLGSGDREARPRREADPADLREAIRKRQKNDTTDAEATCEAAQRPTMSVVAVKTEEQQAQGMLFRTRDLLVRQRTQTINALRGHLAEFGVVAPQGPAHVGRLGWSRGTRFTAIATNMEQPQSLSIKYSVDPDL